MIEGTWDDWTKYYYDTKFLKMLKWLADKKWETELSNFINVQIKFSEEAENIEELLENDELLEEISWVSLEDNFQELSQKEKEQAIKKIKTAIDKLMEEVKEKCEEYISRIYNVIKKRGYVCE